MNSLIRMISIIQKIDHNNIVLLSITVAASDSLLNSLRVPWKVVVHYQRTELHIDTLCSSFGGNHNLSLITKILDQRGAHVSVRHGEGYRLNRALIEELAVLPDFREPDNIRLGLAPLTTSFADVWHTIERLRRAVDQRLYLRYPAERLAVT